MLKFGKQSVNNISSGLKVAELNISEKLSISNEANRFDKLLAKYNSPCVAIKKRKEVLDKLRAYLDQKYSDWVIMKYAPPRWQLNEWEYVNLKSDRVKIANEAIVKYAKQRLRVLDYQYPPEFVKSSEAALLATLQKDGKINLN